MLRRDFCDSSHHDFGAASVNAVVVSFAEQLGQQFRREAPEAQRAVVRRNEYLMSVRREDIFPEQLRLIAPPHQHVRFSLKSLRQKEQRRKAHAAAYEERVLRREGKAVPQGAEAVHLIAVLLAGQCAGPFAGHTVIHRQPAVSLVRIGNAEGTPEEHIFRRDLQVDKLSRLRLIDKRAAVNRQRIDVVSDLRVLQNLRIKRELRQGHHRRPHNPEAPRNRRAAARA